MTYSCKKTRFETSKLKTGEAWISVVDAGKRPAEKEKQYRAVLEESVCAVAIIFFASAIITAGELRPAALLQSQCTRISGMLWSLGLRTLLYPPLWSCLPLTHTALTSTYIGTYPAIPTKLVNFHLCFINRFVIFVLIQIAKETYFHVLVLLTTVFAYK